MWWKDQYCINVPSEQNKSDFNLFTTNPDYAIPSCITTPIIELYKERRETSVKLVVFKSNTLRDYVEGSETLAWTLFNYLKSPPTNTILIFWQKLLAEKSDYYFLSLNENSCNWTVNHKTSTWSVIRETGLLFAE